MEWAKWIVAGVAVFGFGGWVADALVPFTAKQHIRNPAWPPHAKFHNGQTMWMGIGLGLLSLAVLFGFRPLTKPLLLVAAATAAMYWVSLLLAPLFPGTAWSDPEFAQADGHPLGMHPQQLVGWVTLAVLAVGVALGVL